MAGSEKTAGDDIGMRKKRLRYRAWHRGTREMDLILGPYADGQLDGLDASELDRFEALLELPDTDMLKWVMGQEPAPETVDRALLETVMAHHRQRMAQ
jgi:antitoxin CptB